jgi:hypothetical protein
MELANMKAITTITTNTTTTTTSNTITTTRNKVTTLFYNVIEVDDN